MGGILIGGIAISQVSADTSDNLHLPPIVEKYLDEEEQAQLQADIDAHRSQMEERRSLMEKSTREVVKTDDGIQINIRWSDPDDVTTAHDLYDETEGQWGMKNFKGMHMGSRHMFHAQNQ